MSEFHVKFHAKTDIARIANLPKIRKKVVFENRKNISQSLLIVVRDIGLLSHLNNFCEYICSKYLIWSSLERPVLCNISDRFACEYYENKENFIYRNYW